MFDNDRKGKVIVPWNLFVIPLFFNIQRNVKQFLSGKRCNSRNDFVLQLVATRDKLKNIEKQLLTAISLYKKRMEWLTSER